MQFRDVIDDDDYYDVIEEDNNCDVIDTGMITQQSCHVEYLLPQLIWFKVNIRLLEATYRVSHITGPALFLLFIYLFIDDDLVLKLNFKWGLFSLILRHDAAFCQKIAISMKHFHQKEN